MKKLSILLLVVSLLGFTACGDDDEPAGALNFTGKNTSTVKIDNASSERLVAFDGQPGPQTKVFGIEAQTKTGIDVTMDNDIHVLYFVKYSDYQAQTYNAPIVASVMAYYDPNNEGIYDVDIGAYGNAKLYVINRTAYYAELRDGSPNGAVFTIIKPWESGYKQVAEGNVNLFTILKGAQRVSLQNPILKIVSKTAYNSLNEPLIWKRYLAANQVQEFKVATDIDLSKMALDCAVIALVNNGVDAAGDENGGYLKDGSRLLECTKGGTRTINPGASGAENFFIQRVNNSATTVDISGLKFTVGDSKDYTVNPADPLKNLIVGCEYTVTVPATGSYMSIVSNGVINPTDYEAAQK